MSALDATACGEEATDDAGDVVADVKIFRIVDTYTLHAKAETADARKYDCLTFRQPVLEDVLKFCYHHDHRSLGATAVPAGFLGNVVKCDLTLTDGLGIVFPIPTAALDIVPD